LRLAALRLVDGAGVSRENIEHSKARALFPMTPGRSLGPRPEFHSMDFLKLVPNPAGYLDSGLV
jgi:hypothetical protein